MQLQTCLIPLQTNILGMGPTSLLQFIQSECMSPPLHSCIHSFLHSFQNHKIQFYYDPCLSLSLTTCHRRQQYQKPNPPKALKLIQKLCIVLFPISTIVSHTPQLAYLISHRLLLLSNSFTSHSLNLTLTFPNTNNGHHNQCSSSSSAAATCSSSLCSPFCSASTT